MDKNYLLVSDLDGTLIPAGKEPFNKNSLRELGFFLKNHKGFFLAYASGRSIELVESVIEKSCLPEPNAVIVDVGTTIYLRKGKRFYVDSDWREKLLERVPWGFGKKIKKIVSGFSEFVEQGESAQKEFKQSYYIKPEKAGEAIAKVKKILSDERLSVEIVYSEDCGGKRGLVDFLPKNSSKGFSIDFLRKKLGLGKKGVLVAGDSENDLSAILFGFNAVVVGNAREEFKQKVRAKAEKENALGRIYFSGESHGFGILEALNHFGAG